MAAFEWPGLNPLVAAGRPGIYISGGLGFTDVGVFSIATTLAAENTADSFAYYPYDRIALATRAGVNWFSNPGGEWGAWLYHQNEIRRNDGTDWPIVHVTTGQENLLDYGIHTGLYQVWGSDGVAYLVGMYPGANAGEVGAVRYNYETGAWDSWVEVVGAKFTACTYPLAVGNRLLLATEGSLYAVDPAQRKIRRTAGPAVATDARDKLFVLSDRLFWAGVAGGTMRIWEDLGGWQQVAILGTCPIAAGGEWALVQDYSRVGFVFFSGLRQLGFPAFDTYLSHFSVEAPSSAPLSALSIVDHTLSDQPLLLTFSIPIPLNTSVVAGGQHESDFSALASTNPQLLFAGGSAITAALNPFKRLRTALKLETSGVDGPLTSPTSFPTLPGSVTYPSLRYGFTDGILSRDERIEPYKVEEDPVVPGALRIHYAAHTRQAGGLQMSVRIYYRDTATPGLTGAEGSPHPLKAATIAHVPSLLVGYDTVSGAFNNVAQKRIDNVPLLITGADHYVVWDRNADLGAGFAKTPPFQLAMNFPGSLPPL